jgi:glycosyltransferase involved in cell wall biosynthesis
LDVLVLPYRNEPFGRTLLEAWLVGTPVIATDFGGIGKVIRRGENGLLVSYGDVAGLKSAILSILDDRALRERFREEGRRTVRQGFDIRKTVGQIEALYRECMDLAATDGSRSRRSFVRERVGQ